MLSSRPIHLEDGPYFPTKTPGRGLKNRAENAHAGGVPMTIHGKGKNVAPKTPFQPSSVQPQRLFKDQKIVLGTNTRPLGDKTPLPNRVGRTLFQTPLPQKSKLSKLSIIEAAQQEAESDADQPPGSMQRPSSLRTHLKHPRISNPKDFQTPMNKGNHWDISDGDIVVPDAETLLQEPIVEDEDDFDELEYGPPNTLDLPYQPPFDFELPDYKEVGKTLRRIAFSVPYDDTPPLPDPEIHPSDVRIEPWDMISLPPLESDDPFHLARLEIEAAKAKTKAQTKLAPSRLPPRTRPAPPTAPSRARSLTVGTVPKPHPQSSTKLSSTRTANTKTVPPPPVTSTAPRLRAGTISKPTTIVSKAPALAPGKPIRTTAPTSQVTKPKPGAPLLPVQRRNQIQAQLPLTSRTGIRPHTSLALTSKSKPSSVHSKTSSITTTKSLMSIPENVRKEDKSIFNLDDGDLGVGDDFMFEV
ncbi:hypothetical protein CPB83DRAFT_895707 [Crepidotus variabilis]|uniref:Uncharacterized protein n=1 Tax=Crepidotus variabilis TaxID=179855 RepID=A0A9P6ED85_9AGAR|nr:hypothetical protein CPB83DRAFT_895707 [Crepidotus variabilis]